MEKEYAEYMFQRLSAETAVRLIRSFPLRAADKDVLIDGLIKHRCCRGWQKVYAGEINVDVKTVSRLIIMKKSKYGRRKPPFLLRAKMERIKEAIATYGAWGIFLGVVTVLIRPFISIYLIIYA